MQKKTNPDTKSKYILYHSIYAIQEQTQLTYNDDYQKLVAWIMGEDID